MIFFNRCSRAPEPEDFIPMPNFSCDSNFSLEATSSKTYNNLSSRFAVEPDDSIPMPNFLYDSKEEKKIRVKVKKRVK